MLDWCSEITAIQKIFSGMCINHGLQPLQAKEAFCPSLTNRTLHLRNKKKHLIALLK